MTLLVDGDRARVWRALMRYWSMNLDQLPGMLKNDVRAAVDATDQWIEDNQASFNTALPVAFRTNTSQAQKTLLFCAVAAMRVSLGFFGRVLGVSD